MKYTAKTLQLDMYGGITSAIVALPLALAFGYASGLGPTAGLYGAIILGFIAAALGGTSVQISGPTGPMTVVMAGLVIKFGGSPEILFMIVFLCGIIQTLFGVFRLGAYVNYVPLPVISGFMTGIGCIIILMELLPIFGDYSSHGSIFSSIGAIPQAIETFDPASFFLGVLTFIITIIVPKKWRQYVPSPLAALTFGTVIAILYFPDLKTIGEIASGIPHITNFALPLQELPSIITSAFMLALLGSIDTLLTSTVADKITKKNHDSNKELIGQGIGNSLVGLMGGIPGAGATMRTVVNINAGGQTRMSGMLHALFLLAIVTLLGNFAEKIPLCVLAGLLLKVGFDIIDWDFIKKIKKYPKDKIFLMFSVLILTIFSDLIAAIGLGLILSHMIYSKKMHKNQLNQIQSFTTDKIHFLQENTPMETNNRTDNGITIKLSGHINYTIAKDLSSLLNEALVKYNVVYLDFKHTLSLDLSIISALEGVFKSLPKRNNIHIKINEGETYRMLQLLGLFDHINAENIHIIQTN
ncbi:MAG: SulP family inorganic anion transporter [Emcibacter sp.]|nr:SulP family inorganic anion transporter [Emcibacter sp.]